MKSKDQQLLEEAYFRTRRPGIDKKVKELYNELADKFGKKLHNIFGDMPFTKKTILGHKEKFEDLDKQYQAIFNTEYSLFSFEDTQERLSNLLSTIGIQRPDMKFETGPKGMIYWFESKQ